MKKDESRGSNRKRQGIALAVIASVALLALALLPLIGCAPQNASSDTLQQGSTENTDQETTITWSADMDCATCHLAEDESRNNSACLASRHEAETCTTCHTASTSLEETHASATATGTMPAKLSKKNTISDETCLNCHGTWEELADKSVDVTVFTDANGTVANPHALDRSGDHQIITCITCHTMHKEQEDQMNTCLSCHHEDVFECYTCHE